MKAGKQCKSKENQNFSDPAINTSPICRREGKRQDNM